MEKGDNVFGLNTKNKNVSKEFRKAKKSGKIRLDALFFLILSTLKKKKTATISQISRVSAAETDVATVSSGTD